MDMRKLIVFTLLLSIFALPCTAEVYTKAPDDIPAAVPYPCDTEQVVFIMRECAEDEMPLPMAGDKQHGGRVYSLTNGQWYGLLDMEYEPDIRVVASSVLVYCSITNGFDRITVQVDTLQDGEWKYAGAAQVGAGEVCEIRFQKPLAYMIHYLIPDYPDGSGWYFDPNQPEEDYLYTITAEDVYEWDTMDGWKDIYAEEMAKDN